MTFNLERIKVTNNKRPMGHIAHLNNSTVPSNIHFVAYAISISNFEPISGAQVLIWGLWLGFNNLESTLSEDACIVILQIVALQFLRSKYFKHFLYISILKFEPIFGPQYWSGGHCCNNLESTQPEAVCIVISQIVAL